MRPVLALDLLWSLLNLLPPMREPTLPPIREPATTPVHLQLALPVSPPIHLELGPPVPPPIHLELAPARPIHLELAPAPPITTSAEQVPNNNHPADSVAPTTTSDGVIQHFKNISIVNRAKHHLSFLNDCLDKQYTPKGLRLSITVNVISPNSARVMEQLVDTCFEAQQAIIPACRDHYEYIIEQIDIPDLPGTEDPGQKKKIKLSDQYIEQSSDLQARQTKKLNYISRNKRSKSVHIGSAKTDTRRKDQPVPQHPPRCAHSPQGSTTLNVPPLHYNSRLHHPGSLTPMPPR